MHNLYPPMHIPPIMTAHTAHMGGVHNWHMRRNMGYWNLHSTLHKLVKQLFLIGFLPQKARIRIGVQIWA